MLVEVLLGIILCIIAALLLLHHGWHHSHDPIDSDARQESCAEVCFFQIPDIRNHETWILICVTNAFSLAVLAPLLHFEMPSYY